MQPLFNVLRERVLFERARSLLGGRPPAPKTPVILIPGVLGSQLAPRGEPRLVWGDVPSFYSPPARGAALKEGDVDPRAVIEGIPILPGLWEIPVYRDLTRFLELHCGYERDRTLFLHAYDFRPTIDAMAADLTARIEHVTSATGARDVILLGHSHGGFLGSWVSRRSPARIRAVIALATAFRGALDNLRLMIDGYQPAPLGFSFDPSFHVMAASAVETIPPPGSQCFADGEGRPVDLDLYDADAWARHELGVFAPRVRQTHLAERLAEGLARARRVHARMSEPLPADAPRHIVIGTRALPTLKRALLVTQRGERRCLFPSHAAATRRLGSDRADSLFEPGDGEVPVTSLSAWAGAQPGAIQDVEGTHRGLINSPATWVAVARALAEAA
jgi:pimeloyl-ACP methyl ester carboxylesterase